jgi:hypothetical protein
MKMENRVLRRIFGPKRDEVTVEWRKLHNEELCDLYSSPSIIRIIKSSLTSTVCNFSLFYLFIYLFLFLTSTTPEDGLRMGRTCRVVEVKNINK